MTSIYLDHAAGTPTLPEVQKILQSYEHYGNPSSPHTQGRGARGEIDRVRILCRDIFRCGLDEIFFTSGATESMHMAVIGSFLGQYSVDSIQHANTKILVSPLVHSCVWSAVGFLERCFGVSHEILPTDRQGLIDVEAIDEALLQDVSMVICEHGSSEFGHLQPVAKVGKKLERVSGLAGKQVKKPVFVVDCAASAVTEKLSLEHQKCDLLVLSGEKIGGLPGSGLLLKRSEIPFEPVFGGSQEFGYRGGTENVLGIMCLGEALKHKEENRGSDRDRIKELHVFLRTELENQFSDACISTPKKDFLPHVLHIFLPRQSGELIVQKADLAGFSISAGSACSSGGLDVTPSHRFISDLLNQDPKSGIRISLSAQTSQKELEQFLDWIKHHT